MTSTTTTTSSLIAGLGKRKAKDEDWMDDDRGSNSSNKKTHKNKRVYILWDYEEVAMPYGASTISVLAKLRKEAFDAQSLASFTVVAGVGKLQGHFRQMCQDLRVQTADVKAGKPDAITNWILTEILGMSLKEKGAEFILVLIANEREALNPALSTLKNGGCEIKYLFEKPSAIVQALAKHSIPLSEYVSDCIPETNPQVTAPIDFAANASNFSKNPNENIFLPTENQKSNNNQNKKQNKQNSNNHNNNNNNNNNNNAKSSKDPIYSQETVDNFFLSIARLRADGFAPRETVIRAYYKEVTGLSATSKPFQNLMHSISSLCEVEDAQPNRIIWPKHETTGTPERWNGIDINQAQTYASLVTATEMDIIHDFVHQNEKLKNLLISLPRSNQIPQIRFGAEALFKTNQVSELPQFIRSKSPAEVILLFYNAMRKNSVSANKA